jgi:hypothetical protein
VKDVLGGLIAKLGRPSTISSEWYERIVAFGSIGPLSPRPVAVSWIRHSRKCFLPNSVPSGKPLRPRKRKDKAAKESRRSRRFQLEVDSVVWESGDRRSEAVSAQIKDISPTGLYLHGAFDKPLRSSFEFELRLPAVPGCKGGVLRGQAMFVRRESLPEGRIGFGAEIFQYDFLPESENPD